MAGNLVEPGMSSASGKKKGEDDAAFTRVRECSVMRESVCLGMYMYVRVCVHLGESAGRNITGWDGRH